MIQGVAQCYDNVAGVADKMPATSFRSTQAVLKLNHILFASIHYKIKIKLKKICMYTDVCCSYVNQCKQKCLMCLSIAENLMLKSEKVNIKFEFHTGSCVKSGQYHIKFQ